jgi:hypothetical protein
MIRLCFLIVLGAAARAAACDICAVYTATEQREAQPGFWLGVAEQYSHFGTELQGGHEVTLPAKEHMDSSVTQFVLGYTFTPRLWLQLNIPYIYRSFTRIHDHELQSGTVSGIGDMSLLGDFLAYSTIVGDALFRFSTLGGIKFPTGDPSELGEEFVEPTIAQIRRATSAAQRTETHAAARAPSDLLPLEGGLHGHDLALGSGSFDGIVGGQIFWSWHRAFVAAGMQYAIRSTGAFDYRYANDLTWVGGPGWYLLLEHDHTLGLQAVLSGETKGNDTQQGHKANDTAITSLYIGPGVSFTWETSLSADVAVDLPVLQHNTGLQLVPDVRARGGITWRF